MLNLVTTMIVCIFFVTSDKFYLFIYFVIFVVILIGMVSLVGFSYGLPFVFFVIQKGEMKFDQTVL